MARLNPPSPNPTSPNPAAPNPTSPPGLLTRIPARQHFAAVAYLRWRLFRNGLRRKGGTGDLIARIISYPIFGLIVLSLVTGTGGTAYFAASRHNLALLAAVFWAIFLLQVIVSINIAAPGLSFDPESLIRFPLSFPRYLTIRLFLGLLSASTIVGTLCLLAAALGIALATPALAPIAFAAALALALANMLFTRMVFAWVDRWLSTRRAREILTALLFLFSIGVQYLNVTFNGVGRDTSQAQQQAKIAAATHLYARLQPVLNALPPGLAGDSISRLSRGSSLFAALDLLGILAYAALFLAVFARRMHREYRGENLSQAGSAPAASPTALPAPSPPPAASLPAGQAAASPANHASRTLLSPVITACLLKELLYVRRNTAQFYGILAPLAMVFLFAGRLGSFAHGYTFPAAMSYSFLGIAALSYNSLGLDAAGVQLYFIAPVPMRSIMLAKNIFGFLITALQVIILYLLLSFTSGRPPLLITLGTLCWVVFAALVNVTIGNIRSITAPKKLDPARIARRQASPLSALLSIGILLATAALGLGLLRLATYASAPWLPVPILLTLAFGALAVYIAGLHRIDALALAHREILLEELTKVSA